MPSLLSDAELQAELSRPAISAQAARTIASHYASTRTPEGCTFKALSEGRRMPAATAAAAVEYELMQDPGNTGLEALQDWIWS